MAILQYNWPLMRCLVSLRRIAAALDRAYPPPRPAPRRAEFSVASPDDFNRGWDRRLIVEDNEE
jgi:hypothetical protein